MNRYEQFTPLEQFKDEIIFYLFGQLDDLQHGTAAKGSVFNLLNTLADNVSAGLVNNIIVAGFGDNTIPFSIYTAAKGVFAFALTSVSSINSFFPAA